VYHTVLPLPLPPAIPTTTTFDVSAHMLLWLVCLVEKVGDAGLAFFSSGFDAGLLLRLAIVRVTKTDARKSTNPCQSDIVFSVFQNPPVQQAEQANQVDEMTRIAEVDVASTSGFPFSSFASKASTYVSLGHELIVFWLGTHDETSGPDNKKTTTTTTTVKAHYWDILLQRRQQSAAEGV